MATEEGGTALRAKRHNRLQFSVVLGGFSVPSVWKLRLLAAKPKALSIHQPFKCCEMTTAQHRRP
jgi:hypothetical protein